jgi:hypothetical protein
MSHVETQVARPYIMFVDTPEQSSKVRLDFASSGDGLRASSSHIANGTELAKIDLLLGHSELVSDDPAAFHRGFMSYIADHGREIMITVKGDPEAIAQSLAAAAIPEEMKVTYPPLPEPQV